MKEIKFRAFGKLNTKYEVMYIPTLGEFNDINDEISNLQDVAKVMQYTGLKDKNGVEIYEGDIVKGITKHEFLDNIYFHKGIVDFKDGCFVVLGEDGNYHILSELSDLEIIGNIYENKELKDGEQY